MSGQPQRRTGDAKAGLTTFGLLLIDGFPLMSYASISEPFRAANVLSGETLYRWSHVSVDGGAVRASNGASILADSAVGADLDVDMLFVVAGGDLTSFSHRGTLGWLRALARRGVRLGGVSGGPFILGRAGLLDGYRCTIHWDDAAAFGDHVPRALLESGLYVIDRGRLTCAGGSAGLDLAGDLIEADHGPDLALKVSEWFIRTQARPAESAQRMSLQERYGVRSAPVLAALARMEAAIEVPESRQALAKRAGVSVRQLERLFAGHLGATVSRTYLDIRLGRAATLLQKTPMSVTAVSAACGFASSSHFSRRYKQRFGRPPSR